MADTLSTNFTTEFSTNWIRRIAQTQSKLSPFVTADEFMGEKKRYDRLSSSTARQRTERNGPTPIGDFTTDSRWAYRTLYDIPAKLLDPSDSANLGALILPTGDLVKNHGDVYNRTYDAHILSVLLGSVFTGEAGTTVTSFNSSYQIAAGGTGLTLTKLLTAREIMAEANVPDDGPVIAVVSPHQITNLLNTTEVKSADYNTVRALASGTVDTFMGFRFIQSTLVALASTTRSCVAFHPSAVRMFRGSLTTDISKRTDRSLATQIYSQFNMGGTRVHDEAVIQIDCYEA